jgi:hypothetical protein
MSAGPIRRGRIAAWSATAIAGLSGTLGAGCWKPKAPAADASGPAADLARDDRIAWLLAPCSHPEPFLADTGDPVAILVSKLSRGQLDPLRQAKSELAGLGEAALPELRRLCERSFRAPEGAVPLLNALSVLGAMDSDAGHDLLVEGLAEAQDTVRIEAIRGLTRHAVPADYDRLMAILPLSTPDVQRTIGAALATADPERYEDDFATWLEGPREGPDLWVGAPERVATARRPAILARFRAIYPGASGAIRAYLAAAVAASGDEAALEALRADLKDEHAVRRALAADALASVGEAVEAAPLLVEDRDETIRASVASALAALPPAPETAAWLRKGLRDRVRAVRQVCLAALARAGDGEARDAGLAMLEGDRGDLESAMSALREAWAADPAYAARALYVLVRLRTGAQQPVRVDPTALDRAIAQLPLVAAAQRLYECARTTRGEIDGMPAHRWYLMQAGNTGAAGRTWLRERWDEETDPSRRVDLVMAGSYDRDAASREFLLRVAESDRSTPPEVLYAANLSVHQGPTAIVAPRLKRVALRIADARVRPAINCLLWQWYGEGT